MFRALAYFLATQNGPSSSCMFPAIDLDLAISQKSLGSFYWRLVLETMILVVDMLFFTGTLFLLGLLTDKDIYVCIIIPHIHMHAVPSLFSSVRFFVTLWTVACQALLSMGFFRQEYISGLPCPPPGDFPNPGMEPTSLCFLHWLAGSLPLTTYMYIY